MRNVLGMLNLLDGPRLGRGSVVLHRRHPCRLGRLAQFRPRRLVQEGSRPGPGSGPAGEDRASCRSWAP